MTAHVLCPGPSLAHWPDSVLLDAAIRVGVNRAVHRARCTHWAHLDIHPAEESPAGYPVQRVTLAATEAHLRRRRIVPVEEQIVTVEQMAERFPADRNRYWPKWSSMVAVVAAAWAGADDIRVYGMDRAADQPDWDGVSLASNRRTADRFADEVQIFRAVAGEFADRGIAVRRMLWDS